MARLEEPQNRRENVRLEEPHILSLLSCIVSHKTWERMCGSKNHTFSLPCRVAYPTKCKRECAARRTAHSLCPAAYHFPQNERENVRLFEPHILSLPVAYHLPQYRSECAARRTAHSLCLVGYLFPQNVRGNVRLEEPHIFSAYPVLSSTKWQRECVVLRTAHSLCLLHTVSHKTVAERT